MKTDLYDPASSVIVNGDWGQVTLSPAAWNFARWSTLKPKEQQHVYMCHASLPYFFHKIILPWESEQRGENYPETLPDFMEECLLDIQSITKFCPPPPIIEEKPAQQRLCYVIPMGHFKTTMLCVGVPMWLIGREHKSTFLIACSSHNLATDRVVRLKEHIGGNGYFIDMFGSLKPEGRETPWSKDRATVVREVDPGAPTFQAFGTSTDVQGTRFDYGIVDDAVNENNITTAKMRMETYEYITASVWSRLNAGRRVEIVLGTVYHHGDAYSMIQEKAETDRTWLYIKKTAIKNPESWPPDLPDGADFHSPELTNKLDFSDVDVLWPAYWTPERLYQDYCGGPHEFARTRMNEPSDPESKIFKADTVKDMCRADGREREDGDVRPNLIGWTTTEGRPKPGSMTWSRYAREDMALQDCKVIMSVDPAGGSVIGRSSRKLDYTVFELWAILSNKYRILVDLWYIHGLPIKRVKEEYGEWITMYKPDVILMEADAHQRVTAASWEAEFGVPIRPVLMPKQKMTHFEALADLVHSGLLLYPWARKIDRRKFGKFENEICDYPDGKNDDTLAAALHAHMHVREKVVQRRPIVAKNVRPKEVARVGGRLVPLERQEEDYPYRKVGLHKKLEDTDKMVRALAKALGIK